MSMETSILLIITSAAALFLAWRGLQSHGLSFEKKAMMAVAWVVIIAVLAFAFDRFGA